MYIRKEGNREMKETLKTLAIIFALVTVGLFSIGVLASTDKSTGPVTAKRPEVVPEVVSAPEPVSEVDTAALLAAYDANEIKADADYKGKRVRVSGVVGGIKKSFTGGMYMTIGTGERFELISLQCSLRKDQVPKLVNLSKGDTVTVEGRVSGLMLNVHLKDCAVK